MILKGEIAQGDRKIDVDSANTGFEEDRDAMNFRRKIAPRKAEEDKEDKLGEQQSLIADGDAAKGDRTSGASSILRPSPVRGIQ